MRVSLKEYLRDILPGFDRRKVAEIAQLTPSRWVAPRIWFCAAPYFSEK